MMLAPQVDPIYWSELSNCSSFLQLANWPFNFNNVSYKKLESIKTYASSLITFAVKEILV